MNDQTPALSISIVHHDGCAMLRDCLRSLCAHPPARSWEVVVVDNASTDGAVAMLKGEFPQARCIENQIRKGFGANQNQGIEACRGTYILLLNDDTVVHPGALDAMCDCLDAHPECAVVGPRLLNPDGTLQPSCYRFPSPLRCVGENLLLSAAFPNHPVFGDYRAWPHDTERTVDFVIGAAMLVRREVIAQVGGFDTDFFMYAEETDWQKRMQQAGWQVAFCPQAVITHRGGQSSARMKDRQFCEFQRGSLRFMRKHYGIWGASVQRIAMIVGALLRLALWSVCLLFVPARRVQARENLSIWAQLLRWWSGFGPYQGLEELSHSALTSEFSQRSGNK